MKEVFAGVYVTPRPKRAKAGPSLPGSNDETEDKGETEPPIDLSMRVYRQDSIVDGKLVPGVLGQVNSRMFVRWTSSNRVNRSAPDAREKMVLGAP